MSCMNTYIQNLERLTYLQGSNGHTGGSDSKEPACNVGDLGSVPGLGRSSGEGNDNPLQYSCLENSMNRGTWQATYSPWGRKELETTEQLIHINTNFWGFRIQEQRTQLPTYIILPLLGLSSVVFASKGAVRTCIQCLQKKPRNSVFSVF